MRCGEKVPALTLSAWSYQVVTFSIPGAYDGGADGLLITHLYQRTYGAIGYSVIPAIVIAKLSRPRLIGEPDFPGPPTTIRRPFLSASIWPSWTRSLAFNVSVFDEVDVTAESESGLALSRAGLHASIHNQPRRGRTLHFGAMPMGHLAETGRLRLCGSQDVRST